MSYLYEILSDTPQIESRLSVGDFVVFYRRGRKITARVESLHPEQGRRYVVVSRLTKTGRVSTAQRNIIYLSWDGAQKLTPQGRKSNE